MKFFIKMFISKKTPDIIYRKYNKIHAIKIYEKKNEKKTFYNEHFIQSRKKMGYMLILHTHAVLFIASHCTQFKEEPLNSHHQHHHGQKNKHNKTYIQNINHNFRSIAT